MRQIQPIFVEYLPYPGCAALHQTEIHSVHEAEIQKDHATIVPQP